MLKALKRAAARAVKRRGFAITRVRDPFAAQAALLRGREVRTVFDLGANRGETVARYRTLFPCATVFAFEPFSACVRSLEERFGGDPAVQLVQKAVAEAEGGATLFVSGGPSTHSLLPRPASGAQYHPERAALRGEEEVATTTLHAFCAERGIETIDVLKIDVEGAELRVLRGAKDLLARKAVSLLLLETMFVEHYAGQALYHELAGFLHDHGYSLFDLYDLRRSAQNGQLRWGNALFVSPELRESVLDAVPAREAAR